jgi:hypothetical protein
MSRKYVFPKQPDGPIVIKNMNDFQAKIRVQTILQDKIDNGEPTEADLEKFKNIKQAIADFIATNFAI